LPSDLNIGSSSLFQENISAKERFEHTGKWWFKGTKFCCQWKRIFEGKKECVYPVLDKKTLKFMPSTVRWIVDSKLSGNKNRKLLYS